VTYVNVNGMATWQEVSSEGFLVVLLHGAFRRLVLVGADAGPGPGRIPGACYGASGPYPHPDVQDPLSYQVMADDTEAYLDGVVGGPAHLVGWNDGAVVALLVARRHPDLVDRLLLIGQYCNSRGKVAGGLVDQLSAGGNQLMGFLRVVYHMVSPDGPEHFPVVHAWTLRMLATEPQLDLSSLAAVAAPLWPCRATATR
jgi:pimeloyl-ACP methyl ester carboxylesterase